MSINFRDFSNRIKKIERSGVTRTIEKKITPSNLRESFFNPRAFKPGDVVLENGVHYEILDKRSNYLVLTDVSGTISKKFVNSITECDETSLPYQAGTFKGIEVPSSPVFAELIEAYTNETITDAYLILKAIKLFNENKLDEVETLINKVGISMIVEATSEDQIKAARIIAQAVEVKSNANTAAGILVDVANAIKTKKLSSEQRQIMMDMLKLVTTKLNMKVDMKLFESSQINDAIRKFSKGSR